MKSDEVIVRCVCGKPPLIEDTQNSFEIKCCDYGTGMIGYGTFVTITRCREEALEVVIRRWNSLMKESRF